MLHEVVLGGDLERRQSQAHHVVWVTGWHAADCQSRPITIEVTGQTDLGLTGEFTQPDRQHIGRLLLTNKQMDVDVSVTFNHDAGHRAIQLSLIHI